MGKELTLTVRDVNSTGQGVAVGKDGKIIFIDGALPSETVRVSVEREKKNYSSARILDIETPSEDRVVPICPWFGRCGGCQLQHGNYELQLRIKKKNVKDAMERIGGFSLSRLECMPSPIVWGYRNKASFPVRFDSGGRVGFFRSGSHDIVQIDRCPVLMPHVEELYRSFRDQVMPDLKKNGIPFYDERRHSGFLRHIIFRGNREKELLAVAVVTSLEKDGFKITSEKSLRTMKKDFPRLTSAVWNENSLSGNRIIGDKTTPIWGDGLINEKIDGHSLSYDGTAFFQVNPYQADNLFRKVSSLVADGGGRVVELYAGVGALTVMIASAAQTVLAVEEWAPSIDRLMENMSINDIDNVRGACGRAEKMAKTVVEEKPDLIVVDPPRSGCASEVLNAVTESSAKKMVYVSCNPSTLARDCALLAKDGWRLDSIESFDLFPQTVHVETVTSMSRIVK